MIQVPDRFVRGGRPAKEARSPVVGKSDVSPAVMRIWAAAFGPIPRVDSKI